MKKFNVIGLMSGTSLDGLDVACCDFYENNGKWSYKIIKAVTKYYSDEWNSILQKAHLESRENLIKLDSLYGKYLAELIIDFINEFNLNPDFISSHGHTIFHQPEHKFTLQIGNGQKMAEVVKLPVISDFRSLDVSLGGQGAPLVPIGDKLLFSNYDFCINLGGIANISFDHKNRRIAYDICPVNMALNALSMREGFSYDQDGLMASKGNLIAELLNNLNDIKYYRQLPPKSLSREWFESEFLHHLNNNAFNNNDLLRTMVEHIAMQISFSIKESKGTKGLITGGGTHNSFLVQRIKNLSKTEIIIPSPNLIDFKEAIVFGFLGVLRMQNQVNCLSSVTGASRNNCGGIIAWP